MALVLIVVCGLTYALSAVGGVRGGIAAITSEAPYRGSSLIGPFLTVAISCLMLAVCGLAAYFWAKNRKSFWVLLAVSVVVLPPPAAIGVRYLADVVVWVPLPYFLGLTLVLLALTVVAFLLDRRRALSTGGS